MLQTISKRRAPGEIRDAIVAVLQTNKTDMSPREIQIAVEAQLGPVAASSVRSYLRLGTVSSPQAFIRPRRGRYQLAQNQ